MKLFFVDTSAWIALVNADDGHHPAIKKLITKELTGGSRLVTTELVVGETWTFLRMKTSHENAVSFLNKIESSKRIDVHHVDSATTDGAFIYLRQHPEPKFSYVDATSFLLMKKLKIAEAITLDSDFAAAGFTVLRQGLHCVD